MDIVRCQGTPKYPRKISAGKNVAIPNMTKISPREIFNHRDISSCRCLCQLQYRHRKNSHLQPELSKERIMQEVIS